MHLDGEEKFDPFSAFSAMWIAKIWEFGSALYGLKAAVIGWFDMSFWWARIARNIVVWGRSRPDFPRPPVLGDYQREQDRRSAIWVAGIIITLVLLGWLFMKWIELSR